METKLTLLRSAALTGFVPLVRSYGLDPLALAKEAQVPTQALFESELRIAATNVAQLLELAATRTGAVDFGLLLADTRRISNTGPIGLLASMQPSLRKMLDVLARYQRLHIEALTLLREESDRVTVLKVEVSLPNGLVSRHVLELIIGTLCRYLQTALGPAWRPKAVMFRFAAPRSLAMHRQVFRCTPTFGADFDGLVLDSRDMDVSLGAPDPVFVKYIEAYVDQLAQGRQRTLRNQVSDVIAALLPAGTCRADTVAAHLGMDRRTLNRRLANEGVCFRDLMEEKRAELVFAHVAGKRKLSEIAELVGLASASGLSHWCRRHLKHSLRDLGDSARPGQSPAD